MAAQEEEVKKQLYQTCMAMVEERIAAIQQRLMAIEESRESETKSSVGDKYETGRAMLQQESENLGRQLQEALTTRGALERIPVSNPTDRVVAGSLVLTSQGAYFVAIGLGKVRLGSKQYYCISPQSPVGQLLIGKQPGEVVTLNGTPIRLEVVC